MKPEQTLFALASRWGDADALLIDSADPSIRATKQLVQMTADWAPGTWSFLFHVDGFVTGDKLVVTWDLVLGIGSAAFNLPIVVDTSVWGAPPVAILQQLPAGTIQVTARVQQFLGAGTKRNVVIGAACAPFMRQGAFQ